MYKRFAAGKRQRANRIDVIFEFGEEARAVVRKTCPVSLNACSDQRQSANPRRRIRRSLGNETPACIEELLCIVRERHADDDERSEQHRSYRQGHE